MSKIHEVKTLPEFFCPQVVGAKPFDVRRVDRDYHEGDTLRQREWTPDGGFTGRTLDCEITYILSDPDYCKEGFVVLGLRKVDR